jgi:CPA2 family monovalent cation:H+ antiporter-2
VIAAETLSRLALFADLGGAQLAALAEMMEEESFARDARVLRSGISGSAFYLITDGEASVRIDGQDRVRLHAGDFFGEISILTGEPVFADVVAASEELRCAVLPGPQLRSVLTEYPQVAVRMLEAEARRLRATTLWAG